MFKQESDPHYYCPFQDPDRKDADPQRLRAVDPDSLIYPPGSGSGRGKFERKKLKNARKLVEIVILL